MEGEAKEDGVFLANVHLQQFAIATPMLADHGDCIRPRAPQLPEPFRDRPDVLSACVVLRFNGQNRTASISCEVMV